MSHFHSCLVLVDSSIPSFHPIFYIAHHLCSTLFNISFSPSISHQNVLYYTTPHSKIFFFISCSPFYFLASIHTCPQLMDIKTEARSCIRENTWYMTFRGSVISFKTLVYKSIIFYKFQFLLSLWLSKIHVHIWITFSLSIDIWVDV